jgi:hypothetical protein
VFATTADDVRRWFGDHPLTPEAMLQVLATALEQPRLWWTPTHRMTNRGVSIAGNRHSPLNGAAARFEKSAQQVDADSSQWQLSIKSN